MGQNHPTHHDRQAKRSISRRGTLKTIGAGIVGAGVLSTGVPQLVAAAEDGCPYNAEDCFGSYTRRVAGDPPRVARGAIRGTQSVAAVYFAPNDVADDSDSEDAYLHEFHVFGHGSIRQRHPQSGEWARNDDYYLVRTGFRISANDPISPAGSDPARAAGKPSNTDGGSAVSYGVDLATLLVSRYYPTTGLILSAANLAGSLIGEFVDDGGSSEAFAREWTPTDISSGPDLTHYASFRLEVPNELGRKSNVTIESYSEEAGGSELRETIAYTVENPDPDGDSGPQFK